MYYKIVLFTALLFAFAGCNSSKNKAEAGQEHAAEEQAHDHAEDGHAHEEPKFQYTAYSDNFELFAEADAFTAGEKANVLSHFSTLPDFKALEEGKITLVLSVNGKEVSKTLEQPTRKGIYSFDIQPETAGKGSLKYAISTSKGTFEVIVPEVTVFADHEQAHEAAESAAASKTNTAVFTKEQSWKVDFATGHPNTEPFGQVIKTTALVQAAQGNEMVVTAKSAGVLQFSGNNLLEGKEIKAGQVLFAISGNGLTENNISVKYAAAKSNYEKASADFERAKELAKDKIVSEKDLAAARNQYETTKAVYDNLTKNANENGQSVSSPLTGFIKQVFAKNGSFVEAGQAVLVVSQNKTLTLTADVPQRFASILGTIQSANIHNLADNTTSSLEELNGKVLSFGKATNSDNYLIPVTLQIDNKGSFVPGGFVEVYLKTVTNSKALTVPETALLEEQGNYFVWVQITPELFEKREVKIGGNDGLNFEITGGITPGDRIVTRGAMLIKLAQATGALDAHSGHVH